MKMKIGVRNGGGGMKTGRKTGKKNFLGNSIGVGSAMGKKSVPDAIRHWSSWKNTGSCGAIPARNIPW